MTTDIAVSPAMPPAGPDARDQPTVVAVAWPTGRPIYPYTPDEIAEGVDVYTRHLKARRRAQGGGRDA
ncbi:hypothetical protein [Mangrovihabitans endophyticus]|uniref:Uncharacterized protein n=1 Tax=Mangrovihabitans endophyticus TaxID=1751298 RepID=A0A8J3FRK5_9ACTN|nr:hypothetical protein [Mangrovihabitans endophyticus]GGL12580.1 hypothetical protein GCM10012284_54050 [Mangrovihabitans endophyticus]